MHPFRVAGARPSCHRASGGLDAARSPDHRTANPERQTPIHMRTYRQVNLLVVSPCTTALP